MNIIFLARQLDYGGAERQIVELAKGLHRQGTKVAIAFFYRLTKNSFLEEELRSAGVSLYCLQEDGRPSFLRLLYRLIKVLQRESPDILHAYNSGTNVTTILIRPFIPRVRVVWGVRSSELILGNTWKIRLIYRSEAFLSRWSDLIIANSVSGCEYAVSRGFPEKQMTVVSNGIDTEKFRPDPKARKVVRREWGFENDSLIVGIVGHIRPIKDHATFLRAMAQLAKLRPELNVVFVGEGREEYQQSLFELASELDLEGRLKWIGTRSDMRGVYNSLDLLCSSSLAEGFSNVIGEAMACGVPCVVTRVGDSARIVGEAGVAVPPRDPDALAKGCDQMLLRMEMEDISSLVRNRILENYSIHQLVNNTLQKLDNLVD